MGLYLEVATGAWQAHLDATVAGSAGAVPVAKGNGYGFGLGVLADQADRLGCPVLAVGTVGEGAQVRRRFAGDVLVLQPWRPESDPVPVGLRTGDGAGRLLRTVAHLDVLAGLADGRGAATGAAGAGAAGAGAAGRGAGPVPDGIVVEMDSPLHRHGIGWDDLDLVRDLVRRIPFEGIGLHLPLAGDRFAMAMEASRRLAAAEVSVPALWVSHLNADAVAALRRATGLQVRARVGTALWLGAPHTFRARADVLDSHVLPRGTAFGYRGRRLLRPGQVVVVAGGTSHGVGIRASVAGHSVGGRLRAAAVAGLEAAGIAPSPFSWQGHRLVYADSPHMQVSMVYVPRTLGRPRVGDVVDVAARMTLTAFDNVVFTSDDFLARSGDPVGSGGAGQRAA